MKKRTIIILLVLIVLLGGGGIVVWKLNKNQESKSSDNSPTKPSLSQLSDKELEKCLLEDFSRRLELEKYFVFNLGKEVKERTGATNATREIRNDLSNDLTKLTTSYEKKLGEKGHGLLLGKIGDATYYRIPKKKIAFVKEDFGFPSDAEWVGDKLNEKITNGKNCYIVFEKESDEFPRDYFHYEKTDETGKQWFSINDGIYLRIGVPSTIICESKEKAPEILKTDPALAGKN